MILHRNGEGRIVNPQAGQQIGRLEIVLAFVFGCTAPAAVLWLAFRSDSLSSQRFEILRIVLALAGDGVGAVVPGFLDLPASSSENSFRIFSIFRQTALAATNCL
jgi:hypothetical protein